MNEEFQKTLDAIKKIEKAANVSFEHASMIYELTLYRVKLQDIEIKLTEIDDSIESLIRNLNCD